MGRFLVFSFVQWGPQKTSIPSVRHSESETYLYFGLDGATPQNYTPSGKRKNIYSDKLNRERVQTLFFDKAAGHA